MARKGKGFKAKLNKRDLAHFAEMSDHGRVTLKALKAALEYQREKGIKCPECNHIANKLGVTI